jgi:hypothetical protein
VGLATLLPVPSIDRNNGAAPAGAAASHRAIPQKAATRVVLRDTRSIFFPAQAVILPLQQKVVPTAYGEICKIRASFGQFFVINELAAPAGALFTKL